MVFRYRACPVCDYLIRQRRHKECDTGNILFLEEHCDRCWYGYEFDGYETVENIGAVRLKRGDIHAPADDRNGIYDRWERRRKEALYEARRLWEDVVGRELYTAVIEYMKSEEFTFENRRPHFQMLRWLEETDRFPLTLKSVRKQHARWEKDMKKRTDKKKGDANEGGETGRV